MLKESGPSSPVLLSDTDALVEKWGKTVPDTYRDTLHSPQPGDSQESSSDSEILAMLNKLEAQNKKIVSTVKKMGTSKRLGQKKNQDVERTLKRVRSLFDADKMKDEWRNNTLELSYDTIEGSENINPFLQTLVRELLKRRYLRDTAGHGYSNVIST